MKFHQDWPLWVLLAALLPILIHMLNRLRYKTVQWAAMFFLLKANKAATRRARLKQYLLLLFRALAILFLVWAMMRPYVGGWLGAAAGGAPEVIVVLLDRSASMEARGVEGATTTKREHALALLAEAAKRAKESRFVLIENVLREPLEISSTAALATMQMAEATDTAADIPALLRAAVDYLVKNRPGSAEVWLASDLQKSNWRDESAEWKDLNARLGGLSQKVPMRVIDLSASPATNRSVAVVSAEYRPAKAPQQPGQLALALELRAGQGAGTFPLTLLHDGATSQSDLTMSTPLRRESMRLPVPRLAEGGGWGKVSLPADDLAADNTAYFAYRTPVALHAAVVSEQPSARRLTAASAPDRTRADRTAALHTPGTAGDIRWKDAALIVWQAPAPAEAVEKSLRGFVESGGVLLTFPTGNESSGPLGVTWATAEATKERITSWEELDGPLARTDSGASLPLARLEITQRQIPQMGGETSHVYAVFADGRPFLIGQRLGAGEVLACAVPPDDAWSTLGEGPVLLPMMQRLLAQGGARLAPPTLAVAGEWKPQPGEIWTAIETERRQDPRWHAGIYRGNGRLIALNRPTSEDVPDAIASTAIPALLPAANIELVRDALTVKADSIESEIWPIMIVATMIFMILEMLLATSKSLLPQKPRVKAPRPVAKNEATLEKTRL